MRKGRTVLVNSSVFFQETFPYFLRLFLYMFYVYILKSKSKNDSFYVGYTSDLKRRLAAHNRGDSIYTSKHSPWKLINYFAFINRKKTEEFEIYLKTSSGRKFQHRHFGE